MIRRALSVFAFALAACGDGTGPTSGANGVISFTFIGAGGGSFYVAARAPNTAEEPNPNSSVTLGISDDTITFAGAFKSLGGGRGDGVAFGLTRATVGSAPIADDCDPEVDVACAALIFVLNFDTETETHDYQCGLVSGTIEITQITSSRIVGTFSGTGECVDDLEVTSPFVVTGGTFNVYRMATESLEGARAPRQ